MSASNFEVHGFSWFYINRQDYFDSSPLKNNRQDTFDSSPLKNVESGLKG